MPNEDVTVEDLKATAEAKVEEVVETAQTKIEDIKETVNGLSVNTKLVITGAVAVVVSVVVSRLVAKYRVARVDNLVVLNPIPHEEVSE